MAWGPGGLYVAIAQEGSSGLGAQNRGSVVVLDPESGAVRSTVAGLYDPTGLAVVGGRLFATRDSTSPDHLSPSPWVDLVEVYPSVFTQGRATVRPR